MVKILHDGAVNLYTALAFLIADTIAIALRIISKGKTKNGLQSDDWWTFAALVFFSVYAVIVIYAVAGVAGSLESNLFTDIVKAVEVTKLLWLSTFFFFFSITSTKISILCLYRSIFATPRFRLATHLLTVLCSLWCIMGIFFTIFECKPIRAAYDFRLILTARCKPYGAFVFGMEFSNLMLDFFILALPVFVIRTLHLETRRKLLVASIFLLGGFVLITCALRIVYSYSPHAPRFVSDFSRAILWTTIEIGTAIICACLPTFRRLVSEDFGLSAVFKSWYSSFPSSKRSRRSGTGNSSAQGVNGYMNYDHIDNDGSNSTDQIYRLPGREPDQGESLAMKPVSV